MHKFRKKFKKMLSIGAILTLCLSFALPIHAERHEYDSSLMVACQLGSFADLNVAIKKGARFALPDWKFAKAIEEGNRTKILELKDEDRVYWNANVVNIQIQAMCDRKSPVITDEYLNFLLVSDILYKGHRNVYAYALDRDFNETINSFQTLNPDIKEFCVDSYKLHDIFKENDFTKLEKYISKGLKTNDLLYCMAESDWYDMKTPHNPEAILQIANFLLEHGADPNYICKKSDGTENTPLREAAKYSNARLVHFLLEHGANPGAIDPPSKGVVSRTVYDLCVFGEPVTDERKREQTYIANLFDELNDGKPLKPYNQEEVDNSPTELTWSQFCGCNIL